MPSIEQRRPLRPGGVDLLSPQPPGLVPSETPRAGCPIAPRPRNQRTYAAACAAAQGDPVAEFDASEIVPGMRAWVGSRFLPVIEARHLTIGDIPALVFSSDNAKRHPFVLLRLAEDDRSGWIVGELTTPVYVLAAAPDAIHAPGAGATADESTAARR
ncbi:MAG: hypothetical protein ACJ786_18065 [Catenulispora sp.]